MFKTVFIGLYCALTLYLYLRARRYFRHKAWPIRTVLLSLMVFLCACLSVTMFWGEHLPFELNFWAHQISHFWLFSFAYTIPLTLAAHIVSLIRRRTSTKRNIPENEPLVNALPSGKREWIGLVLILLLGTGIMIWGYRQYKQIQVVRLEVGVEDWQGIQGKELKVVLASDLHLGYTITRQRAQEMVSAIMREKPDLILLGGDLIDRSVTPVRQQHMEDVIRELRAPYGVWAVMGNHESYGDTLENARLFKDCGIRLLKDSSAVIPGVAALIGRRDIGFENYRKAAEMDTVSPDDFRKPLRELKPQLSQRLPVILLDHVPKIPSEADLRGIDLMFSGHTHNGQIFPFNLLLRLTNELSYGARKKGNTQLYVSSGLGLWGARFRLGTQSEFLVVRFRPQKSRKIQVLFTSDMHSQLIPERMSNMGGFARLSTAIQKEKASFQGPTLLLDAGDFMMGSKYHTLFTEGPAELNLMHQIGYEAVAIGNHEFDFTARGMENAMSRYKDASISQLLLVPNIDARWRSGKDSNLRSWPILGGSHTRIIKKAIAPRDTLRVGIFSILGKTAMSNAPAAGIRFTEPERHAKKCVAELRQQGADLIIALSHNGISRSDKENDIELSRKVPGIDLLISGHSHHLLRSPLHKGTLIAAAGSKCTHLGKVVLSARNGWQCLDYQMIPLDSSIQPDPRIEQEIDRMEPLLDNKYFKFFGCTARSLIGSSDYDFPSLGQIQSHFGDNRVTQLISDAFVFAGNHFDQGETLRRQVHGRYDQAIPTIGIVGMGNVRASIPKGELRAEDAFNMLSFGSGPDARAGFPLISAYFTREEIKTICEIDANMGSKYGDFQLQFSGLSYASNPYRPFLCKVYRLKLPDAKLYRVITNLYSAQMLSAVDQLSMGLLHITPKDENGVTIQNMNSRILRRPDGSEVKEWWAVMEYIHSFPNGNIPERYAHLETRKDIKPQGWLANISSMMGEWTLLAWAQLGMILLGVAILAGLIMGIRKLIKWLRNQHRRKI